MNRILLFLLCFFSVPAFAQNGFFIQPELGAGIANNALRQAGYPERFVFSYQGQIDAGYKAGKWQFIAGLDYLRTGVKLVNYLDGTIVEQSSPNGPRYSFFTTNQVTIYDPHILLPVKIGYELFHLNNKLSLTSVLGFALAYNERRTFIYRKTPFFKSISPDQKTAEPQQDFNTYCNRYSITGLAQFNFEYRVNNSYTLTFGPSVQYIFTSLLKDPEYYYWQAYSKQYDYALLMNFGFKFSYRHKAVKE